MSAKSKHQTDLSQIKFPQGSIAELVELIEIGVLNNRTAKAVFAEMFETGDRPKTILAKLAAD